MGVCQGISGLLEPNRFAQVTPDSLRLVRKLVLTGTLHAPTACRVAPLATRPAAHAASFKRAAILDRAGPAASRAPLPGRLGRGGAREADSPVSIADRNSANGWPNRSPPWERR